ncbi:MAG: hypothetical protein CL834_06850 [Crocinitomicaceae bacterium]|nr:hypothetical protein [Crocinitomicaceae bacterium]|tara:strand:- start:1928 stop:2326 length:399 start_codon:yes stop_codon:yes gene_type:complete
MLNAVLSTCWFCACWGMPDWPADGIADAEWVEQALEWRLTKGIDACGQEMLALDALSLEWVSKSLEINVEIRSEEWPFLAFSPELTAPLIQLHAWSMMQGLEIDKKKVNRVMKRIARRTKSVPFRELKGQFS